MQNSVRSDLSSMKKVLLIMLTIMFSVTLAFFLAPYVNGLANSENGLLKLFGLFGILAIILVPVHFIWSIYTGK